MLPFKIWCDYLEDRSYDTRLLRTEEPEGFPITSPGLVKNGLENFDLELGIHDDEGDGEGYGWFSGGLNDGNGNDVGTTSFYIELPDCGTFQT